MSKSWVTASLSDVSLVFTDGDWIESKDQSPSGIRLIQTGNVGIGEFKDRAEKARYISPDTFRRLRCEEIFEGDCLISRLPDPVGRACIIPASDERLITAVDCTIVRFDTKRMIPEFFKYFSQSTLYLAEVEAACTGATRKRISRNRLGNITILLPSIPEQKSIVAILNEAFEGIDTAIANTEKNLANARALFDAIVARALCAEGTGWSKKRLGDVVTRLTNGYVGPTRNIYHDSGVPYLLARHVRNNRLEFDGKTFVSNEFNQKNRKSMLETGDVLLVQSGHIGHSAVVSEEHNGHNCHAMIVISTRNEMVTGKFLSLLFNSASMRGEFEKIRSGSTVPHLTCREVRELSVELPSLAEQQRILDRIQELRVEMERLEMIYCSKLLYLGQLKQSILRKAFSGELTAHPEKALQAAAE